MLHMHIHPTDSYAMDDTLLYIINKQRAHSTRCAATSRWISLRHMVLVIHAPMPYLLSSIAFNSILSNLLAFNLTILVHDTTSCLAKGVIYTHSLQKRMLR